MLVTNQNQDIVSKDPVSTPQEIKTIEIASPNTAVIATDNRYNPRINLITHVSGSEWIVNYYSQILTTDSQLSGQQLSLNATNQQYKKINQFKFKVSSPLTTSQNTEDNSMEVVGESIIPNFIIPNVGDMFVADLGEGNIGVFKINRSTKLSILKETTYQISYILINTDQININDLESKTVDTYYYHEKYVTFGKNPLVLESEYSALLELEDSYRVMIDQYFKRFYSRKFSTLILPGQDYSIYDHYLVSFIMAIFSTWDHHLIRNIVKFNVVDDPNMESDNLWTAILNKNVSYINTSFKRFGLIDIVNFSGLAVSCNIRYTGIQKVIYPKDAKLTVDNTIYDNPKTLSLDNIVPSADGISEIIRAYNLRNVVNDITKDTLYLVTKDDYYVLSQDFYNKTSNMSVLEGIVWDFIEGKDIDNSQLLNITKTFTSWGLLEQFYYIPIIMIMIKNKIGY